MMMMKTCNEIWSITAIYLMERCWIGGAPDFFVVPALRSNCFNFFFDPSANRTGCDSVRELPRKVQLPSMLKNIFGSRNPLLWSSLPVKVVAERCPKASRAETIKLIGLYNSSNAFDVARFWLDGFFTSSGAMALPYLLAVLSHMSFWDKGRKTDFSFAKRCCSSRKTSNLMRFLMISMSTHEILMRFL
eukprot:Lithocolla_globosa_v1_NODE_849_length_3185_cov_12.503829.p3 type:complete len:189 gc:universal NODE_849_length_3185_cov_12.503829:2308-2874(+)